MRLLVFLTAIVSSIALVSSDTSGGALNPVKLSSHPAATRNVAEGDAGNVTALVELSSTLIYDGLLTFIPIPGVQTLTEMALEKATVFLVTTGTSKAANKLLKTRVAVRAVDHALAALIQAIFGLAVSIATVMVPGIIMAVASITSHLTALYMAIQRLGVLKAGVALQDSLCDEGAPLAEMRHTLQWVQTRLEDKANVIKAYTDMAEQMRGRVGVCDEILAPTTGAVAPSHAMFKDEELIGACTELKRLQEKATSARSDLDESTALIEDTLAGVVAKFTIWREKKIEMVKSWTVSAVASTKINTGNAKLDKLLDALSKVEFFISGLLPKIGAGLWDRVVCMLSKGSCEPIERDHSRLDQGDAKLANTILRWDAKANDFKEVKRATETSIFANKDAEDFTDYINDMLAGFESTDKILEDVAKAKPFYASLDLEMQSRFGSASLSSLERAYTGPLFISPLSAPGAAHTGSGGWSFRTAHTALSGEDLYTWRRRNHLEAAVEMCKEFASFETKSMWTGTKHAHHMAETARIQFSSSYYFLSRNTRTIFTLVPDWNMAADSLRMLQEAEQNMVFGTDCSTRCMSLYKNSNSDPTAESGRKHLETHIADMKGQRAGLDTEALEALESKYNVGDEDAEVLKSLDFATLGSEEAKLCTNNLAEAVAWYCTLANIGIETLNQAKGARYAKPLFMAATGPTSGGSVASHLSSSSLYLAPARSVGPALPVMSRLCSADRFSQADARLEDLHAGHHAAAAAAVMSLPDEQKQLAKYSEIVETVVDRFLKTDFGESAVASDAAKFAHFEARVSTWQSKHDSLGFVAQTGRMHTAVTSQSSLEEEGKSVSDFEEEFDPLALAPRPALKVPHGTDAKTHKVDNVLQRASAISTLASDLFTRRVRLKPIPDADAAFAPGTTFYKPPALLPPIKSHPSGKTQRSTPRPAADGVLSPLPSLRHGLPVLQPLQSAVRDEDPPSE